LLTFNYFSIDKKTMSYLLSPCSWSGACRCHIGDPWSRVICNLTEIQLRIKFKTKVVYKKLKHCCKTCNNKIKTTLYVP